MAVTTMFAIRVCVKLLLRNGNHVFLLSCQLSEWRKRNCYIFSLHTVPQLEFHTFAGSSSCMPGSRSWWTAYCFFFIIFIVVLLANDSFGWRRVAILKLFRPIYKQLRIRHEYTIIASYWSERFEPIINWLSNVALCLVLGIECIENFNAKHLRIWKT